jgi:two-component system sensor histidine kinase AlgZ
MPPHSLHRQTRDALGNELVIPDCCNIGIVFRTLVAVNGAVLLGLLARGQGWELALSEFVEAAMIVELVSLLSLSLLCAVRQCLIRRPAPPWVQRLVCGLVPAALCGALVLYLERFEWFAISYPRLHAGTAALLCFVAGMLAQHYFELRSRAFSPALFEARLQGTHTPALPVQ